MRTALVFATGTLLVAQEATVAPPQTTPEATAFERTSTVAEVEAFLAALPALSHGNRLRLEVAGKSHEGRALTVVRCARPDADESKALRALLIANIHAGEIEGKEALQQLAREFALGQHDDVLQHAVVWLLPVYNADGNERIAARNRPEQNGPDAVGERANGQGLDLNRDFVKAEAPETRALLGLFARLDPHVFMDLHTTDGSWHGYHLTHAPSLSPNVDAAVADLGRRLIATATAALRAGTPKWETFDYGNFETRDWDGSGAPESKPGVRGWWSYDHRARYGINYFGLRNRLAVLSEAYSNCDFKTRIAVTHDFVLAVLRAATTSSAEVREVCAAADRRCAEPGSAPFFGFDTVFGDPEMLAVLVGDCDRVPLDGNRGTRFVRKDVATPETMPVFRRFRARQHVQLPLAWAIPDPPGAVVAALALHGVRTETLTAARTVEAETFAVANRRKPKRPYQGHQELQLDGACNPPAAVQLPAGTLWVPARQPLARLAAQLLEPQSEDSLSTWNFLEASTGDTYPVLRVQKAD